MWGAPRACQMPVAVSRAEHPWVRLRPSLAMVEAAAQGVGAALLPARMFERDLRQGRLVAPSAAEFAPRTIGSPA